MRNVSMSIYRAVRSSLTCACEHAIGMQLAPWTVDIIPGDEEDHVVRDTKFHLALSCNKQAPGRIKSDKTTWEELIIEPTQPVKHEAPPSLPRSISDRNPRIKAGKVKSVSFAHMQMSSSASSATLVETDIGSIRSAISSMTLEAVTTSLQMSSVGLSTKVDLCETLRKSAKARQLECYGNIFVRLTQKTQSSQTDRPFETSKCYAVYPALSQGSTTDWQMVSLYDILEHRDALQPATYRERLKLAVLLSSSVLQLHHTDWLPEIPSSKDIFFTAGDRIAQYQHVFVVAAKHSTGPTSNVPIIRNPTLLALGICSSSSYVAKPSIHYGHRQRLYRVDRTCFRIT